MWTCDLSLEYVRLIAIIADSNLIALKIKYRIKDKNHRGEGEKMNFATQDKGKIDKRFRK